MKKAELEKIMSAESTAWEKLCERRWVVLVNSNLPRGCGFSVACEYSDAASERESAAWNALHELCVGLGVKESQSEYAFECQTNFWRYATNK